MKRFWKYFEVSFFGRRLGLLRARNFSNLFLHRGNLLRFQICGYWISVFRSGSFPWLSDWSLAKALIPQFSVLRSASKYFRWFQPYEIFGFVTIDHSSAVKEGFIPASRATGDWKWF
jgi:hypothetical protein